MRDQLAALVALKFLLLKHTLSRSKGTVVSFVFLGILLVGVAFLSVLGGFGLFWAGYLIDEPIVLLAVCDGLVFLFLFLWAVSLLTELQRSDIIDLRKMLYLPVSLKMVFLLNYAGAILSPALVLFLVPAVGFCLGLCLNLGIHMAFGFALAVLFYLALAAWTYYVRGVLAMLMENKRRRRTIIAVVTVAFVLAFQLPNLIGQVYLRRARDPSRTHIVVGRSHRDAPEGEYLEKVTLRPLIYANTVIPFGWLPLGVYGLAKGTAWIGPLCFLGLAYMMTFGLALGFRSTNRYYLGVKRRAKPKPGKRTPRAAKGTRIIDRTLPFVDDDTAAVAMASFLNYARHPNIRMLLIMPLVIGLVLIFMFLNRGGGESGRVLTPLLVIVWPFLNFGMIFFNVFGIDREAFPTFILLPTSRHKYLAGKNLALFPFVGVVAILFIAVSGAVIQPPISLQIVSLLVVLQLYLAYSIVGNLLSVYFPFGIKWQGMRGVPTSRRQILTAVSFLGLFLIGPLMLPAVACIMLDAYLLPWLGYEGWPLGPFAAAVLLALTFALYAASLKPTGDLLRRRERRVLELLTSDKE
ncbi:MAG TPA: hypothetical protein HPP77_07005 [Candidatus Hydrogenedentes bacterium]|nr:hypothetical protein [Candidatus Hydrogenedentota bacterium]HIJ73868.1 hypothetical protein [Candidatus Hydrogenedentota bacterium]